MVDCKYYRGGKCVYINTDNSEKVIAVLEPCIYEGLPENLVKDQIKNCVNKRAIDTIKSLAGIVDVSENISEALSRT